MKALIAVHAAHCQPHHLAAVRETWAKDLQGADCRFFRGDPDLGEADVVHVPGPDGPIWERPGGQRTWFLNRKTESICQYAFAHGYDFVFKCDDDTYIRTEMLLKSGFEAHDYSGFTHVGRTDDLGDYHWAIGGSGYWLSRQAMSIVIRNGLHRHRAEDYATAQILAVNGLRCHHDERYAPQVTLRELSSLAARRDYITLHKVNPWWMHKLHQSYQN